MSFWDLNKDGNVSIFERGVQLASTASLINKGRKPGSCGTYDPDCAGKADVPDRPSRLDGAIGVFGAIAGVSTVLMLILAFYQVFGDFDTSGMSYEEAMRAIDLRFIPVMVCAAVCAVSWMVTLVLAVFSRRFPERGADASDGEPAEK